MRIFKGSTIKKVLSILNQKPNAFNICCVLTKLLMMTGDSDDAG